MTDTPDTPDRLAWQGPHVEAGNTLAVTHGAYSPRMYDPLAENILTAAAAAVTWWLPADMATAWAWARTEARIQIVTEWLAEHGGDLVDDVDEDGKVTAEGNVRSAALLLNRLEARAESLRSKLGLDPLSRARLGRDKAAASVDMATLLAQVNRGGPDAGQ